jgi:hypothetical protein
MAMSENGNVGIGTTNPQVKLEVAGGPIKTGALDDVPTCTPNLIGSIIFDGTGDGGLCVCSRVFGVYKWFRLQTSTWGTDVECY